MLLNSICSERQANMVDEDNVIDDDSSKIVECNLSDDNLCDLTGCGKKGIAYFLMPWGSILTCIHHCNEHIAAGYDPQYLENKSTKKGKAK